MSKKYSRNKNQANNYSKQNINLPVYLRILLRLCRTIRNVILIGFIIIIVGLVSGVLLATPAIAMVVPMLLSYIYSAILLPSSILCGITIITIIISKYIHRIRVKGLLLSVAGDFLIIILPGILLSLAIMGLSS